MAWLSLACAILLLGGCGQSQPIGLPPSTGSDINLDSSAAPAAPLPPDEVPVIAVEAVSDGSPDSAPMAGFLTSENRLIFADETGRVKAHSGLEIVQKAAEYYRDYQYSAGGEEGPWPALTDLSLLVKYRVLPALPAPPAGQKFVVDSKTFKVSLVNQ